MLSSLRQDTQHVYVIQIMLAPVSYKEMPFAHAVFITKCKGEDCVLHQCKGMGWLVTLHLACRQLRFFLYSGAVTTKPLAMVVFLYYPLSLALWSFLCLMPLA